MDEATQRALVSERLGREPAPQAEPTLAPNQGQRDAATPPVESAAPESSSTRPFGKGSSRPLSQAPPKAVGKGPFQKGGQLFANAIRQTQQDPKAKAKAKSEAGADSGSRRGSFV